MSAQPPVLSPFNAEPEGQALPTRLNVRTLRADDLHKLILKARSRIDTLEQVSRVAFSWPRLVLDVAIADLVADGRLAQDTNGKLIVRRRATSARA